MPDKVSIIIPTKDRPDRLATCLKFIADNTDYPNYEVIVIQDDECLEWVRAFHKGVDKAKGKYVVNVDDDVEVQKGWLTNAMKEMHELHGGWGAVGLKDNFLKYLSCTILMTKKLFNEHRHDDYLHFCYMPEIVYKLGKNYHKSQTAKVFHRHHLAGATNDRTYSLSESIHHKDYQIFRNRNGFDCNDDPSLARV